MLDKNTIGVIQQWDWAADHPILYTIIEVSPHTIFLVIAILVLKLKITLSGKSNKR